MKAVVGRTPCQSLYKKTSISGHGPWESARDLAVSCFVFAVFLAWNVIVFCHIYVPGLWINQIKSSIFQTNRLSFSSTFCAAVGLLMEDRTTLIWRRIDVIVGSPSKKSRRTSNICGFLRNAGDKHGFTYPTWTIIIPALWIQSENVDIKMQVRDRHGKWTHCSEKVRRRF